MAVFDESKVINALHTDKAEIGKKYWFSNFLEELKDDVMQNNSCGILKEIGEERELPFYIGNFMGVQFLYPYEEPEKKLVPFTWEDREQLRGKWIKSKVTNKEYLITGIEEIKRNGKEIIRCIVVSDFLFESSELLEGYTFLDGSPCGKVIDE